MSQTGGPSPPDDPDDARVVAAGEIALGLARLSDVDRTLRDDPELAREVERWSEDFARLAGELEPIPPQPRVWAALHRAMQDGASKPAVTRSLLESLRLWRWLAGFGFAAAAALAVLNVSRGPGPQPPITRVLFVAALLPKDGPPLFTATYDPSRRTFIVIPAAVPPGLHQSVRLWLAANDDDDPIALAALEGDRPTVIRLTPEQSALIKTDTILVVTGEATASQPGPVLAHGRLQSF